MINDAGASCFTENRNLFSDPRSTPEKFNLYNGLLLLAQAVTDLSSQIDQMNSEMQDLQYKLRQHGQI